MAGPPDPPGASGLQQGTLQGPENLRVRALRDTDATIEFDAPSSGPAPAAYDYNIFIAGRWVGWRRLGAQSFSNRSFSVSGLTALTRYPVVIRSVLGTTRTQSPYPRVTFTTLAPSTTAPGAHTAEVEIEVQSPFVFIRVRWTSVDGGVPTRWFTQFDGGRFISRGVQNGYTTRDSLRNYPLGSSHTVAVRAFNPAGSNTVTVPFTIADGVYVPPPPAVAPGPPENLAVSSITQTAAEASWDAPATGSPPTAYEWRIGETPAAVSAAPWAPVSPALSTTLALTGLAALTGHILEVRALAGALAGAAASVPFMTAAPVVPPEPVVPADIPVPDALEAAIPMIGKSNVRALAAAAAGHTNVRPGPLPLDAPKGMRRYLANVLSGRRTGIRAPEGLPPNARRVLNRSFGGR